MAFDGQNELSKEQMEELIADELAARRGRPPMQPVGAAESAALLGAGAITADVARKQAHGGVLNHLMDEFQDIREDPELAAKNWDQLVRTYEKYVDKTGNPVEYVMDMPGSDYWAAATLKDGSDVVFMDSSAPHPGVMAHELGHIAMNHHTNPFTDPMAYLQTSGIGRFSGENAATIGGVGAGLGAVAGAVGSRMRGKGNHMRNQALGTAIGGAAGVLGGSGQYAYEQYGASRRAHEYLPEDVSHVDVAGDLAKAGTTYFLGGPIEAATAAAGVGATALAAMHPDFHEYAGRRLSDAGRVVSDTLGSMNVGVQTPTERVGYPDPRQPATNVPSGFMGMGMNGTQMTRIR